MHRTEPDRRENLDEDEARDIATLLAHACLDLVMGKVQQNPVESPSFALVAIGDNSETAASTKQPVIEAEANPA